MRPDCTAETRQRGRAVPMEGKHDQDPDQLQRAHAAHRRAHALRPLANQRPGHDQHADRHGSRRPAVFDLDRELSAVD